MAPNDRKSPELPPLLVQAIEGNRNAQFELGMRFADIRQPEAFQWLTRAAEQGHRQAQFELSALYFGEGNTEENNVKAIGWLRQAAENGHIEAQKRLGALNLRAGQSDDNAADEGMRWLKLAAEKDPHAKMQLTQHLLREGDFSVKQRAGVHLWELALKGDSRAQLFYIKHCTYGGYPDSKVAQQLSAAAENGKGKEAAEVELFLGDYYSRKNDVEAVRWYRKAAEKGLGSAQYKLGKMYWQGTDIEKDDTQAVQWFEKAAWQGDQRAQRDLATAYEEGRGVEKNEEEANYWRVRSDIAQIQNKRPDSEQGHQQAEQERRRGSETRNKNETSSAPKRRRRRNPEDQDRSH